METPLGIEASLSNPLVCQVLVLFVTGETGLGVHVRGSEEVVYQLPARETLMQGNESRS